MLSTAYPKPRQPDGNRPNPTTRRQPPKQRSGPCARANGRGAPPSGGMGGGGGKPQTRTTNHDKRGRVSHILRVGDARGQECHPAPPACGQGEGGRAEHCAVGCRGVALATFLFGKRGGETPIMPYGGIHLRHPSPTSGRLPPAVEPPRPLHRAWGVSYRAGLPALCSVVVGFLFMIRKAEHHEFRISGIISKHPSPVSAAACCNQSSTSIP